MIYILLNRFCVLQVGEQLPDGSYGEVTPDRPPQKKNHHTVK